MKRKDYEEFLVKKGYEEIDLLEGEDYEWARLFKESICDYIIENDDEEYQKIDIYVKIKDIKTCFDEDETDENVILNGVGIFHIFAIDKDENNAEKVIHYDSFVKILDTMEIRLKDELDQLNAIYEEFEKDQNYLIELDSKNEEWTNA